MNNEADAMQQFVVWLLQTLDPVNGAPSGDWNQATEPEQAGSVNLQYSAKPLSSAEELGILNDTTHEVADSADRSDYPAGDSAIDRDSQPIAPSQDLSMPLDEELSLLAFGDIPAVQNRFHALLKNRLKSEIERKPPRFPWETEQHDYQYDPQYDSDSYPEFEQPHGGERLTVPMPQSVPEPTPVWASQIKTLNLPIALPDSVLQTLFQQCCHLIQSSMLEGRRLVQAVESLFPEDKATLENLAGLVLTSPARGRADALSQLTASNVKLPIDYSQASRPQQMVLSLLAARQMFAAMTLTLSPDCPVHRSWITNAGVLTLEAQYFLDARRVQIQAQLPTGGRVRLEQTIAEQTVSEQTISEQTTLESIASCTQAGQVSVSLSPLAAQSATLTVELAEADSPLVFAVRLLMES